jgi:iron(III) transport system ATP-binding protein
MNAIDVRGLKKRFDTDVLVDVDLHVPAGATTAVLGGSGSGKSTLLRCLAGLLRPEHGEIRIGDQTVFGQAAWVPPERRKVGLVPQEGALFPHLSVFDNVGFGVRGRDRTRRVETLLQLVGLPGTGRMRPHELSGGMQQRVAVARALAPRPSVLLLDEPFSALDAGLRDEVRAEIFAAIAQDGATAVLVTHDQQEAFAVADRVAVVMHGRIVQEDAASEVYRRPASLDVARFVGDLVSIAGTVVGPDLVGTAFGALPCDDPGPPGTAGVLGFRPEDLRIDGSGLALGAGRVIETRYHGHGCMVHVDTGSLRLAVRTLDTGYRPGDDVELGYVRPGRFFPAVDPANEVMREAARHPCGSATH